MKQPFLIFIIIMLNISCDDNPVKPENKSPVIISATVFPETVKPRDSLIVICNAADPDGDTLVYDWYTTGVVKIKGNPPYSPSVLYNTYENSCIFYAPDSQFVSATKDTFWIQCVARDRKGRQDDRIVHFKVIKSQ